MNPLESYILALPYRYYTLCYTLKEFKMSTTAITPAQIIAHRDARKASGMAGCITGRPKPTREIDFFGFRDIQIWNQDANGRFNGDPGFDRKNPGCFCFDCRSAFDTSGIIDAELVNEGHARACAVYANLLGTNTTTTETNTSSSSTDDIPLTRTEENAPWVYSFPQRSLTHYPGSLSAPSIKRQGSETYNGVTLHITPPTLSATTFDEIPTSLPAPRHRDIMNETLNERIKNDLARLRGEIQSELVNVMDMRRGVFINGLLKDALRNALNDEEIRLQNKLTAIDTILNDL